MYAQPFKLVLLMLCCCFLIGSSKKLKCNDLIVRENESWTFTLKIPASENSSIALTKVRLSWEGHARRRARLSVLRKSEVEPNIFAVTYAIRPSDIDVHSKPNIAEIVVGTAAECRLYCRGQPEARANMVTFNISCETKLNRKWSARQNCAEYKPLLSALPKVCGRNLGYKIAEGDNVTRGTLPWLVPVYIKDKESLLFKCGGSIISSQTVLTAAHCLMDENGKRYKEYVVMIFAGRHDLSNWNEVGYTSHTAEEIIVHPQYNGGHKHDIGLINLETPIEFTENRSPVCLWSSTTPVSGTFGSVAGWGLTKQNVLSSVPYKVEQEIVDRTTCTRLNPIYRNHDLSSTICAGGQNEIGPCKGDSGGGLILVDQKGRFSIRGVVSLTREDEQRNMCDFEHFVLYTDVAKHYQWIRAEMW